MEGVAHPASSFVQLPQTVPTLWASDMPSDDNLLLTRLSGVFLAKTTTVPVAYIAKRGGNIAPHLYTDRQS